jgi:hypothetical protein
MSAALGHAAHHAPLKFALTVFFQIIFLMQNASQ